MTRTLKLARSQPVGEVFGMVMPRDVMIGLSMSSAETTDYLVAENNSIVCSTREQNLIYRLAEIPPPTWSELIMLLTSRVVY
jgi:hypothetical protein